MHTVLFLFIILCVVGFIIWKHHKDMQLLETVTPAIVENGRNERPFSNCLRWELITAPFFMIVIFANPTAHILRLI